MSKIIAVAGKGGTGKTTFCALLIRELIRKGKVLAVDADPNSNLNELLGLEVESTIGGLREDMLEEQIPEGMSRQDYMRFRIEQSLVEGEGFDLVVMGRPEGPGCYCYANNLIREYVGMLQDRYDYVVIDNEAGLEHLSRRTTRATDIMFVMSDNSYAGMLCIKRVKSIMDDVRIKAKNIFLVINRSEEIAPELRKSIDETGLRVIGFVPKDDDVWKFEIERKSLIKMNESSKAVHAVKKIIEKVKV